MPRDVLLVIGDDIIECPLVWRSRYFETAAYKTLLKDYFKQGAKWSSGPKPQLIDEQYNLPRFHVISGTLTPSVAPSIVQQWM
ncbi:hypothetical protein OO184_24260 [Photorhabdus sp. APURE]|uniref:hypothetical protein n=1 Tax=Photorhabdus aballayi TaxID=2991723 RepID=UPI00223DD60F|nr:hypothetical protein [Photorhabdus aballayi]MCW7550954.1 hypothetical protein [Photorhabdus aballayi]